MAEEPTLPRRARTLIASVAALAAVAVAVRLPDLARWTLADVAAFGAFASAAVLFEQFQLSLRHRTETDNFSLTDALWVPGLVLIRPSALTFAVLVGTVAGQSIRRWSPHKIVFNASLFVVAISASELVFEAMGAATPTDPMTMLAAVAAMAAFFAINEATVSLIIGLVEGQPFRTLLVLPEGMNVLSWAGNVAIGLLGTAVWSLEPAVVPLLVAPVLLPYLAYRAWSHGKRREEEVAEQRRMRALYEAGESLFGSVAAPADHRAFLQHVKDMVGAGATELIVADGGRVVVHDSDSHDQTELYPIGGHRLADLATPRPGLVTHATPIGAPGDGRGLLVVHRETALSAAERSLVDALASQVAVKLDNRRLFDEAVEQRARLAEVIDNSSDGIAVVSTHGRVTSWNRAMERIVGLRDGDAVGRSWAEVLGTPEDVPGAVASLAREEPQEALVARQDGAERWIRFTSRPIPDPKDEVGGYVVIVRDVTAELETERIKSDFVAMVSHELRTPLTPMKGFLMLLANDDADISAQDRHEYLRIALRQTIRLEALINDLLDVSSIHAGKLGADVRSIELVDVVADQVRETVEAHPERRIRFASTDDAIRVVADPLRVRQVVANLVGNALKYSEPSEPVDVSIEVQRKQAVVSVTDRGHGISPADQDRVFERFHRVENTSTRSTGGSGLGLYIARHLVEAMSGRLWLESEVGRGAKFSFTLPLVAQERSLRLAETPADPAAETA